MPRASAGPDEPSPSPNAQPSDVRPRRGVRAARLLADGPRERLDRVGAAALSEAELLALILRTGTAHTDALDVARDLLARCSGLVGLAREDSRSLRRIGGVGPSKAAALAAVCEVARRLAERRLDAGARIHGPGDVHAHFFGRLRDCPHERFHALLLDGRHRVSSEVLVSQGTLTASLVHPREVFAAAVRRRAAALVLVHNHPSGDPTPSGEDRRVTTRLARAGELLGIRVVDHVVVAERGYYSFSEAGDL